MSLSSILLLALFLASNLFAQNKSSKEKQEQKVIKLISSLPEVQKSSKYIQQQTHGQRHLTTYLDKGPTRQDNRYWLTVAEYNGIKLVPHFNFIVDAKTYDITYWDVINDKAVPLEKWRKHRKN